ncbi:MAG TPA: nucleoside diphosphate kinase regulator, partial [Candidatus Binatia bacterium]
IGMFSRRGLGGWLIGNTAEKILNRVKCSVLMVKPNGAVAWAGKPSHSGGDKITRIDGSSTDKEKVFREIDIVRNEEPTMSKIYITEFDSRRLRELINVAAEFGDKRTLQYLDELSDELDQADLVRPEEIPNDVITMNSTFRLEDLDNGEEAVYSLVFPADADSLRRNISVLAPIGTAVLGYRVGDTVEWEVPAGLKRFTVKDIVYQPEAAGDYHR